MPAAIPPTPGTFLGNQMPQQAIAFPSTRRSRSWGGYIIALIVLVSTGLGAWAIYQGVTKATDAVDTALNQSNELSDPHLSSNDRTALGLSGNEQFLFEGGALAAVTTALDNAVPGQPTNFTQVNLYTDYAIATAQNPTLPDHLDQYIWRTGKVGTPTPQPNDPEAAAMAFTVDEVNWTAIAALVADAVRVSGVEQGEVSYVFAQRDTFSPDRPLLVRIYVDGPRSSGYIEAAADGTVIKVY